MHLMKTLGTLNVIPFPFLKERKLKVFSGKKKKRKINNLRYADDTTLIAESEEELNKRPLDESESGQ